MKILLIILLVILVVWAMWSFYSYSVETLTYKVVEKNDEYEIRQYDPYIAMQTEVTGDFNDSINSGFRVLAGYIFGDNTTRKSVSMTSPVIEQNVSEKINMTAPVMEQESGDKKIITFTAPKEYTIDTLPKPNSEKIKFVQIPSKKYAAYRFSWYYTDKRVSKNKDYLLELLKKDNIKVVGSPMFTGYSDPWTMPLLMRNEILVEVE